MGRLKTGLAVDICSTPNKTLTQQSVMERGRTLLGFLIGGSGGDFPPLPPHVDTCRRVLASTSRDVQRASLCGGLVGFNRVGGEMRVAFLLSLATT